jgi:hypothetical protein
MQRRKRSQHLPPFIPNAQCPAHEGYNDLNYSDASSLWVTVFGTRLFVSSFFPHEDYRSCELSRDLASL